MTTFRNPLSISLLLLTVLLLQACAMMDGSSSPSQSKSHTTGNRWSPSLDDKPVAKAPVFELVTDGKANATIVIAKDALDTNQQAAELLQSSIEKISGAKLPIVDDTQKVAGPVIYIGRSAAVDAMNLDIPSGYSLELKEEGYLIKVTGEQIVLVGNDHRPLPAYTGSLLATVELLQRLGCRWYMPADFGASYPTSKNVSLPALDILEKPDFAVRGFWYGTAANRRKDAQLKHDMTWWQTVNRYLPYGSVIPSAGDGSIMAPFRDFETREVDGKRVRHNKFFDAHPELFAVNKDGSYNQHYICLSQPEVLERTLAHANEYFEKNPDALAFSSAPPDGAPTCECAQCTALNRHFMQKIPSNPNIQDISGSFYWFLNEIALRLEKTHPTKWVATTAYSGRIRPPENLELPANFAAHTALLAHSRHHRYDSPTWHTTERITLYRRWAKASPNIVEREYYPVFQFHLNLPQPLYETSAFNYRLIKDLGMRGSEWESRAAFMAQGLNDYIRGQLLWNINTDMDALLTDHYTRFYGAAGPVVRKFDKAVEKQLTDNLIDHHEEERIHEIYPHDFVVKVTDKTAGVEKLVADADALTKQRVQYFTWVVDHFRAYSDMRHAETTLDFKRAASLAQKMLDIEEKVDQINRTFIDTTNIAFDSRPVYGEMGANASPHGKLKQYQAKQKLIDGTNGKLVAALPVMWDFKTDPHNQGLYEQWYLPAEKMVVASTPWKKMGTTSSWEIQGLQDENARGYNGFAWYSTNVEIPAEYEGKKLTLFIGAVNNKAWVWVNDKLAGATPFHEYWMRWKYHHEIDLTDYIKPGQKNRITIRVWNDQDAGGIFRRSFIYSPNESAVAGDKAVDQNKK